MLLQRKSDFLSGLLMVSLLMLTDVGVTRVCAETKIIPVSSVQSGLHVESVIDSLAVQFETTGRQGVWFRRNLPILETSQSSEQFQAEFAYADPSFSGIANPETPVGVDKSNLIAYVPLPTTAWCFLIGVMTLLGLSKRRNAAGRQ